MRSRVILALFLVACMSAHAFEPRPTVEHPGSAVLATMGFSLHFKRDSNGMWTGELFLNPEASALPKEITVIYRDDNWNVLCKSDHSPGKFVAYTLEGFGKGKSEERFGLRFYVSDKLLRNTQIYFRRGPAYMLEVQEFLPDK